MTLSEQLEEVCHGRGFRPRWEITEQSSSWVIILEIDTPIGIKMYQGIILASTEKGAKNDFLKRKKVIPCLEDIGIN